VTGATGARCTSVTSFAVDEFLARPSAIRDWLRGSSGAPRLVADGKLRTELVKISGVQRFLVELSRAGKLRNGHHREAGAGTSSDREDLPLRRPTRPALAIVTGARTLATFDGDLMKDFGDPRSSTRLAARSTKVTPSTPDFLGILRVRAESAPAATGNAKAVIRC